MKEIKFDQCREILQSGNVVNCQKKPQIVQAKQMFEDFTIETLEHQDAPYKGKKGDYIMISQSGEMYVCDEDYFNKNYEVKSFFDINQFAKSSQDYHERTTSWDDTPFNDHTLTVLRLKKIQKSDSYQQSINSVTR
jgi:hypothetical protein